MAEDIGFKDAFKNIFNEMIVCAGQLVELDKLRLGTRRKVEKLSTFLKEDLEPLFQIVRLSL